MEYANFIELAIAFYKDKTQHDILEKFRAESRLLLEADAEARRSKAREDIKSMAKLKIELERFNLIYKRLSDSCGKVDAVDDFVRDVENRIKYLSYKKNKGNY